MLEPGFQRALEELLGFFDAPVTVSISSCIVEGLSTYRSAWSRNVAMVQL
jgi:hypothetical protein